jgi:hypothetical protein
MGANPTTWPDVCIAVIGAIAAICALGFFTDNIHINIGRKK